VLFNTRQPVGHEMSLIETSLAMPELHEIRPKHHLTDRPSISAAPASDSLAAAVPSSQYRSDVAR